MSKFVLGCAFTQFSDGLILPSGSRGFFGGDRISLLVTVPKEAMPACGEARIVGHFSGRVETKRQLFWTAPTAWRTLFNYRLSGNVRAVDAAQQVRWPEVGGIIVLQFRVPDNVAPSHAFNIASNASAVRYAVRLELLVGDDERQCATATVPIQVLGPAPHCTDRSAGRVRVACSKGQWPIRLSAGRSISLHVKLQAAPVCMGGVASFSVEVQNDGVKPVRRLDCELASFLTLLAQTEGTASTRLLLRKHRYRWTIDVPPGRCEIIKKQIRLPDELPATGATALSAVSHELLVSATDSEWLSLTAECRLPIIVERCRPAPPSSAPADPAHHPTMLSLLLASV